MSRWQCIGEHLNCASATIANCIPSSSVADVAAVAVAAAAAAAACQHATKPDTRATC